MTGNKTKNNLGGYSIIETLVAMSIFITVSTVAIGAFLDATEAQRIVVFEQTISENVNFAMEFMSRQMRTAIQSNDADCLALGDTFGSSGPGIVKFMNTDGQCIEFRVQTGKLLYTSDATVPPGSREYIELISSGLVQLDDFDIEISGHTASDTAQPRATLVLTVSGVPQSLSDPQDITLTIQTTVTTRIIES